MSTEWPPSPLSDIRNRQNQNPSNFPDESIFIVKTLCSDGLLSGLWQKITKHFDDEAQCATWLIYSCYRAYFDFEDISNSRTMTGNKASVQKLCKATEKYLEALAELNMDRNLWSLVPFETKRRCLELLASSEGIMTNDVTDFHIIAANFNDEIGNAPLLSDVLNDVKTNAENILESDTLRTSPNTQNARQNFFIRSFHGALYGLTGKPHYEQISILSKVFFPDAVSDIDFVYVRDRIKIK